MKRVLAIFIFAALCSAAVFSISFPVQASLDGILTASRRGDWNPGIPGGIPSFR